MIEAIQKFFLETVGKELCVFFCSMLPIIELRGAIPLGAALDMNMFANYAISVVGNLLPVPFILLLIRVVLEWMKKVKGLSKIALWLEAKSEKNRAKVEKYSFWGLFLFVAIPLPGTGAWTGALVAALIRMKFGKAFASITLGVMSAGVIMTVISYALKEAPEWLIYTVLIAVFAFIAGGIVLGKMRKKPLPTAVDDSENNNKEEK